MRDYGAERRKDKQQRETLRQVCIAHRENEISRICARYELESDEFYTAREKAERYMGES